MYDWKGLAPTRPLAVDDVIARNLYVPRDGGGAREVDALLDAGLDQPVAIFGPAGAGKSTELAALSARRADKWVGVFVQLDRSVPYGETTDTDAVLDAIATAAIRSADSLNVPLSKELTVAAGISSGRVPAHLVGYDFLLAAVREIRAASAQHAVGLMVDGLEKASSRVARETLANLQRLRGTAHVVVVVPSGIATGPAAAALSEYHLFSIGAVSVSPSVDALMQGLTDGDEFLFEIAARRLGVHVHDFGGTTPRDTTARAIRKSIVLSGGLVRTFLQLLQKAALYAAMRGFEFPDEPDVARAASDQTRFLLRLLKEGDAEALRRAHGTNGLELEIRAPCPLPLQWAAPRTRYAGRWLRCLGCAAPGRAGPLPRVGVSLPIADDEIGPAALLEWGEPIAIAFYRDHAAKAALIGKMRALAGSRDVHEVHRGQDALPFAQRDSLVMVVPDNEVEAVAFFDQNRDRFGGGDDNAHVLLLLLAGGSGERALQDATWLASFAREASFDFGRPAPSTADARLEFERRHGASPETWLRDWRAGALADTFENNYTLGEALAILEAPR